MFSGFRIAALATTALLIAGCDMPQSTTVNEETNGSQHAVAARVVVQDASCVTLLAGQTTPAGSVCTVVDGDSVRVTYSTTDGWRIFETHMWAGTSFASLPVNKAGNPQVGLFPHASTQTGVTSVTVSLPLSLFGLSQGMASCAPVTAYVVAHAVVKKQRLDGSWQSETAYGEGTRLVQKGNWATWFSITLTCAQDEPPQVATEETAFAFANDSLSMCFIGSDLLTTNRWGWSNGPLVAGSYSFDLYAGAGQCDRSKGTLVGSLGILYNGSTATVTYTMRPGFFLGETHLYAGTDALPSSIDRKTGAKEYTVAPGQYGNIHDLDEASSDTYTITGLSGPIFVVAHAVVSSTQW
jgi:hypothetical protein